MQKLLTAGVLLVLSSSSAFALGTIHMSSTSYPDSIVVTATIYDDGSAGLCPWLAITRGGPDVLNGGTDVFFIQRDLGNTINVTFTDTDVQPSTQYCYSMALRGLPGIPCFTGEQLCDAFDCFCQIETCANPGPDPAYIGQGFLRSTFPDGSPVDNNEVRALLYDCSMSDNFIGLQSIPPDAQQYLDSETAVSVSGDYWCCWAQCVWMLSADLVTPQPCEIATEKTTWGRVKSIYRE